MSLDNPVITGIIVGLLLAILGILYRFNNNVVRGHAALASVVEKAEVHDHKIEVHGNKISELIGANNARKASPNHLEPLAY